jgi:hypothetical protein
LAGCIAESRQMNENALRYFQANSLQQTIALDRGESSVKSRWAMQLLYLAPAIKLLRLDWTFLRRHQESRLYATLPSADDHTW